MSLGVPTFSNAAAASLGVVLSERFWNVSQKLVLSASVGAAALADDEESDEPQAAVPPRTTSRAAAAATFVVNIWVPPIRWYRPHCALPARRRHIVGQVEGGGTADGHGGGGTARSSGSSRRYVSRVISRTPSDARCGVSHWVSTSRSSPSPSSPAT